MKWSAEQQNAIDNDKKNILVSAAAGSGKTAVLVERVVSHLLRRPGASGAWSVDRLLVVTFTKAAASEMSQRIRQRLMEAVAAEQKKTSPDKELVAHLERQMVLLSSASISTIDSFCQTVVKNNFSAIDLDPKFRVANENELLLVKQDVMEELFESKYDEGDIYLLRLIDEYGSDKGDDKLYNVIMRLHEQSRNQPFPEKWLRKLSEPFSNNGNKPERLCRTIWWPILCQELECCLEPAFIMAREMLEIANEFDDDKVKEEFQTLALEHFRLLEAFSTAMQAGEWDKMLEALELKIGSLPRIKKNVDPMVKEEFKVLRDQCKKQIDKLKEICIDSEENLLGELDALYLDAEALVNVSIDYGRAFQQAKKEKNIIDYSDMEHYALQILTVVNENGDEIIPSETALSLREKYQEIMVDEYQDTNEVQDTIVSMIAGQGNANTFTVGDVKQSIYGFRSSEPGLFLRKYKEYGVEGNPEGELITLGRNFRSKKEVLSAINYVFAQVMTEKPNQIEYDELAMLNPGEPYGYQEPEEGQAVTDNVELAIITNLDNSDASDFSGKPEAQEGAGDNEEEELTGIAVEAQYISQRLLEIKNSGVMVFDKKCKTNNGYRQVEWRDMVILLRSTSKKADIVQEVLERNGIPAYSSSNSGFFKMTEIMVMRALLSIIDNSQQDIPLAAVLCSPIGCFSPEELVRIRLLKQNGDLYSALLEANSPDAELESSIKAKAYEFVEKLHSWRQLARFQSVPELIWQLYRDTGYYDYVGSMPGGLLRQANLRLLITRAQEFQDTEYRGLFRFLRFIERLESSDNDMALGKTLGENDDVVRIMTIHKSKGLEFPIVVIADMSKGFNSQDLNEDVLIHKELGLGMTCYDIDKSVKYPSFSYQAVRAKLKQEMVAEELRVLYVAMTRAREKLIMVGLESKGKIANKVAKWCRCANSTEQLQPSYMLSDVGSYMDWVASAVVRHSDGKSIASYGDKAIVPVQIIGAMGADSRWKVDIVDKNTVKGISREAVAENPMLSAIKAGDELPEPAGFDRIKEKLEWSYDLRGTDVVPSKLSVSELKRKFSSELSQSDEQTAAIDSSLRFIFNRPSFIQLKADKLLMTNSEYGTLMHSVLQHLDLSVTLDYEGIGKQLESMVHREIISEQQKVAVNIASLVDFFATELGCRMTSAVSLWRELPFSRMLKAKDYYPEVQDEEASIFSQGIIDVLFVDNQNKVVLLDYKTDKNTTPEVVREKYHLQLELYKDAVEQLLGMKVDEVYLYMLHNGSVVDI